MTTFPFTVSYARYAKGMMLVRPTDSRGGLAGSITNLCQALNARWTGRERGFVMSPAKVRKLEALVREGWDAAPTSSTTGRSRYKLLVPRTEPGVAYLNFPVQK